MTREVVTVTVDASGNATAYTGQVTGFVRAIRYVTDGTSPLDTGGDVTITADASGLPILTITNIGTSAASYAPQQAVVSVANAAALYAAAGTAVTAPIPVSAERIKLVVAQGGDAKTGVFHILRGVGHARADLE